MVIWQTLRAAHAIVLVGAALLPLLLLGILALFVLAHRLTELREELARYRWQRPERGPGL